LELPFWFTFCLVNLSPYGCAPLSIGVLYIAERLDSSALEGPRGDHGLEIVASTKGAGGDLVASRLHLQVHFLLFHRPTTNHALFFCAHSTAVLPMSREILPIAPKTTQKFNLIPPCHSRLSRQVASSLSSEPVDRGPVNLALVTALVASLLGIVFISFLVYRVGKLLRFKLRCVWVEEKTNELVLALSLPLVVFINIS
jgi:hypothetical protein